MKLNLGCGGEHKKGYLNVDAFNKTIADKEMEATNLIFDDYSIDEILISQVIEHFGIARSIYALSECFRVLKNSGKLIIETPDIRESFKIYLKGEREDRKYILPWIYGVDMPGMQHRFCFPDDLLEEELEKIGFTNVKKSYIQFDKHQPILRVECKKPKDDNGYQFITKVRKELINKNVLDLDEQINALEKDKFVDFFKQKLIGFYHKKNEDIFREVLLEGAVKSPRITLVFFQQVLKEGLMNKEKCEKYIKLLSNLEEKSFLNNLIDYMASLSGFIGKTEKLFEETYSYGKKQIGKIINSSGKENIEFDILSKKKEADEIIDIDFLSEKLVMLKSNQIFQKGIKAFNEGKNKKAIIFFKKSSLLNRDQILTFWNLGRLNSAIKDYDIARLNYQNAIKLLDYINFEKSKQIKKIIEEEMMHQSYETYNEPLISLKQIYEKID